MEDLGNEDINYRQITETLFQTFEQKLSKDVIAAIVENCGGNANDSANAIMNIIDDMKVQDNIKTQVVSLNPDHNTIDQESACSKDNSNQTLKNDKVRSYASTSAQPAMRNPSTSSRVTSSNHPNFRRSTQKKTECDQIESPQIINIKLHHKNGTRILIMMRGLPGSGKSYLARKIVENILGPDPRNIKNHILSTDDYFMNRNSYYFEKHKLHIAHEWNQNRAKKCMVTGVSPIIIDNTNIAAWELEPYVRYGVEHGYLIEVIEPNTPWAMKVQQLERKNIHNVPIHSIKRMFNNYESGIDGNYIMQAYKMSYRQDMLPPVRRNIPPVEMDSVSEELKKINFSEDVEQKVLCNVNTAPVTSEQENIACNEPLVERNMDANSEAVLNDHTLEKYSEIERQYQEFTKVEQEWEQGGSWDDDSQRATVKSAADHVDSNVQTAKPQRKGKDQQLKSNFANSKENETDNSSFEATESRDPIMEANEESAGIAMCSINPNILNSSSENSDTEIESKELMPNVKNFLTECQDWTKISMFMPPWENESKSDEVKSKPAIVVEKVDSSTCVEIGDTDTNDTNKPYKLLPATARDINLYYVSEDKEKIPEMRMLDKSSMTNEPVLTEVSRCKYEDRHFKTFRKMFKHIGKADLRDIFDRCYADVNWAVNIVLEDMANKPLSFLETEDSSTSDDEITEECDCLAKYNLVPDNSPAPSPIANSDSTEVTASESTPLKQRKSRKLVSVSETSVKLKRQLEKNVVIPDNHYSENFLKVRKLRRGESYKAKTNENDIKKMEDDVVPSTSKVDTEEVSSSSEDQGTNVDSEVSDRFDCDKVEKYVNFDLGKEFVANLDEYFGRQGFEYPSGIEPKINIPVSLLNEINGLWMESFLDQSDQSSKQTELMIKQDEEFARQLALKEAEMAQAGKEPEVPDLKEIMDMEFALSLYQKNVQEEWRNKEPNDLAAKMTRDKLCNLFPDMSRDVLSELLMAHDNNFYATLEGLLLSTGMGEVLETKDDVNKYVMQKELERQIKIVEEQKKALSEFEWPILPKNQNVEMSVVEEYRREADMHVKLRTMIYQKAQEYINRGMTQVATYYSELADLHTRKFEYANCLAAAYLIQVHASKNRDDSYVDLHFLRVAEALESLDLFLDSHIQRLRESNNAPNNRCRTLFFVTGRGIHSAHGQPRIKPACKRRLFERGIAFREVNPGLLTAKVCAAHLLSNQVA